VCARVFEPAQHFARARPVHAQIAGRYDPIGAAGCGKIRQASIERNRVPVDIGEDRDPHYPRFVARTS
jgi:hypothetical protein